MSSVWVLIQKEVKTYFFSPLAYSIAAIYIFLAGWGFYNLVEVVNANPIEPLDTLVKGFFSNINSFLILIVPLLTMRQFSEEKKNGTLDLLFLTRLSHLQIILGKLIGSLVVVCFLLLLTLIFPLILSLSGYEVWTRFSLGYVGMLLNVLSYLTIGLFASSLTSNQMVSIIYTYLIFFVFYLLGWSGYIVQNYVAGQLLQYFSLQVHLYNFIVGIVSTVDLVFYASVVLFFIYLTKRKLDLRFVV